MKRTYLPAVSVRRPCTHWIEKALRDAAVGVDAPVAEEGPVTAGLFDQRGVDLGDENFFGVVRGFGKDAAEGIGEKAAAPELDSLPCGAVAADVAGAPT